MPSTHAPMARFTGTAWLPQFAQQQRRATSPTTSLHGLRGLAAVAVFLRHLLVTFFIIVDSGSPFPSKHPGLQLLRNYPFPLRLPFGGNAMVPVFFLISGYLDSAKPLTFIQTQSWGKLQGHLGGAILRRGPRLFLPALAAAAFSSLAIWLGLYTWGMSYRRICWPDELPPHLPRHINPLTQLGEMLKSFAELLNLWEWEPVLPVVNIHYWTLPYDLRSSFIRYLVILGTARLALTKRVAGMLVVVGFCGLWGRWEVVLSLAGTLLYQLDLSSGWLAAVSAEKEKRATRRTRWIYVALLVASLYLCCFPKENGDKTPGFRWLSWLTPKAWQDYRWWNAWAALTLVWVALHHPGISRFLEGPVPQYLGNISFSMYLTHGPVLHMTAHVLVPMVWSWKVFGRTLGFLVPVVVVVIPSVVLTVHVFSRTVENKIGQWIRRAENAWLETERPDGKREDGSRSAFERAGALV